MQSKKMPKKPGLTHRKDATTGAAIAGTPTSTPAAYSGSNLEKEKEPHAWQHPEKVSKGPKGSTGK